MKTYTTGLRINSQAITDRAKRKRANPKGFVLVLLFVLLSSFSTIEFYKLNEAINTLEDMHEWIQYDASNGRVDSTIAETYIYNLESTIANLKSIN
tara:strand:+ start:5817 stop:6104 length:288 start_codon:yes stop_codon:yes gene_type:complete